MTTGNSAYTITTTNFVYFSIIILSFPPIIMIAFKLETLQTTSSPQLRVYNEIQAD